MDYITGELRDISKMALLAADHDGEDLNRVCVRGLWSVNKVKQRPSNRNRK